MKKYYFIGGLLLVGICLLFTACPENYTGHYYQVTWGSCNRASFEPIWQNPALSYSDTKEALIRESGDSVKSREPVKETALQDLLDDSVRLRSDFSQQVIRNLATRPDAVQSWCRSDDPDTCYWVYVKKL